MDVTEPQPGQPTARDIPEAVQWHEGMLLAPQHFQQAAIRAESLLGYQLRLAAPFHWGVTRLEVDPVPLGAGLFRILDLEAVMPDGLVVVHEAGVPEADLALDLTPHKEGLQAAPGKVHLAVARRRRGAGTRGELARYRSLRAEPVVDENTGEDALEIPRLVPRLHLFVGAVPPPSFASFPLAELRHEDGAFVQTGFLPPCLALGRVSALGRRCASVAARLREKAAYLAEQARSPAALEARERREEAESRVHRLGAALPGFEAVLSARPHPFSLYVALCQLAGQVAGLAGATIPPPFAPYDHDAPVASFEPVLGFVEAMLSRIREAYTVLRFRHENGVFSLGLPAQAAGPRLTVGLRGGPGASEAAMRRWMDGALIGSAPVLASMQGRRILGPTRKPMDRDDALALLPAAGTLLYAVELDAEFIRAGETLSILNQAPGPEAEAPAEVVLYLPQAGAATEAAR